MTSQIKRFYRQLLQIAKENGEDYISVQIENQNGTVIYKVYINNLIPWWNDKD